MLRPLPVIAALVALISAGCGGNGGSDAPPGSTAMPPSVPPASTPTTEPVFPPPATVPPRITIPPPSPAPTSGETAADAPAPAADAFVVGAVDDAARHRGPMLRKLAAAGFGALGITSYWEPGRSRPTPDELAILRDTTARANALRLRVFLAVFHRGSSTTPLTPAARRQFASYVAAIVRDVPLVRDVIVGNEPNINRFWLPQFDAAGGNAAAPAYVALLTQVYDAAKAASPDVLIWGGALASRGNDRPNGIRHTQSPEPFIRGMGDALRAAGRQKPIMDGFAFHPYPETSSTPPDLPHPDPQSKLIGLADYGRLRALVRDAFGPRMPVLYSELGVETVIPPAKRALYEGVEVARPVDERTQAEYYRRALELASCQEGVVGMLLFHSHDEPFLVGFQSGVHYVDGTPKASLPAVREAILAARDGC